MTFKTITYNVQDADKQPDIKYFELDHLLSLKKLSERDMSTSHPDDVITISNRFLLSDSDYCQLVFEHEMTVQYDNKGVLEYAEMKGVFVLQAPSFLNGRDELFKIAEVDCPIDDTTWAFWTEQIIGQTHLPIPDEDFLYTDPTDFIDIYSTVSDDIIASGQCCRDYAVQLIEQYFS